MPFARRFALSFAVLLAASAQLAAQDVSAASSSTEQAVPVAAIQPSAPQAELAPASLAPTVESARVGVKAPSAAPAPFAAPRRERASNSVVMMIVGGAVLIVGAVVGGTAGTIIMIGGGVVGILGLVRYLQ